MDIPSLTAVGSQNAALAEGASVDGLAARPGISTTELTDAVVARHPLSVYGPAGRMIDEAAPAAVSVLA